MPLGRPLVPLVLTPVQHAELKAISHSRSLPHALVTRARIVLLAAEGLNNQAIGHKLNLCGATVGIWRSRYRSQGLPGLYDEPRPGGPRTIEDERVAILIRKTLKTQPKNGTHWSCRSLAREARVSKSTVNRLWRAFGLAPHRQKHFKLSTDPFFVE